MLMPCSCPFMPRAALKPASERWLNPAPFFGARRPRFEGPVYRIRTYNQIAPRGLQRFPNEGFEVGPDVPDAQAILLRSHKLTAAEVGPSVRAVARAGAGVNNVPVDLCTERGVVVFNTPGANANSVKELTLAALLLASRDVMGGMQYAKSLSNVTDERELHKLVEGEKKRFKGHELFGRTLGVVGLGAIGSRVARTGLDLGMQVVGYDPALSIDAAWRLPGEVRRMDDLPSLFACSDYVTLHVPSLPETHGMIDAEALAAFQAGSALLNFARQEIVDESAVLAALRSGHLAAYFSDFPSAALAAHKHAHATPHLGASTQEAEENCAVMAANQLTDFLRFGNIENSVNFPEVNLERTEGYRIAVTNWNVAGTLGQVLSVLAEADINVIDMLNKSRDDVAYNLIDLEVAPTEALADRIEAIDSVIGVRTFDD